MPSLLLVDDNAELAAILREVLEDQGLACSVALSADEALRALRTCVRPPDFILADLRMPGMPVEELLHLVRATPAWAGIVFVLMTAGTKDEVPNGPFDAIVLKPFSSERLLTTLRWVLARRGKSPTPEPCL